MKRKIFLHIGPHKTGTTAFQQTIRKGADILATNDFFVCPPDSILPGAGGYHVIPREIANDRESKTLHLFLELFNKSNCSKTIISSEGFDRFNKEEINRLSRTLRQFDVVLFVVLRHPISLMTSSYCSAGSFIRKNSPEKFFKDFLANKKYIYLGHFVADWIDNFPNFKILFYEESTDIAISLLDEMAVPEEIVENIRLRKPTHPKNIIEDNIHDGRARVSLLPEISVVNYLLRNTIKQFGMQRKMKLHRELIAFNNMVRNDPMTGSKKHILLSEAKQVQILKKFAIEYEKIANLANRTVPQSYFFPLNGVVPGKKYLEKLCKSFVRYSSYLGNENVKVTRRGKNGQMTLIDNVSVITTCLLKIKKLQRVTKKITEKFTQSDK